MRHLLVLFFLLAAAMKTRLAGLTFLTLASLAAAEPLIVKSWRSPSPGSLLLVDTNSVGSRLLLVAKAEDSDTWSIAGEVTMGHRPDVALSPDGKSVAISFDQLPPPMKRGIYMLDLESGTVRFSADNPDGMGWHVPAPSPFLSFSKDGRLLFALRRISAPPSRDDFFLATLDVESRQFLPKVVELEDCSGALMMPGTAAREIRLLCLGQRALRQISVNADGSAGFDESYPLEWPTKSIDPNLGHSSVAIVDPSQDDIQVLRRDGNARVFRPGERTWTSTAALTSAPRGVWFPFRLAIADGRGMTYIPAQRIGSGDAACPSIGVYDSKGSSWKALYQSPSPITNVVPSKDGNRIYASSRGGLAVIDAATGRQTAFMQFGTAISTIIVLP